MPASTAVVLVIDRLGAGWLGPYGNTWVDTPHFNRLAAQSLLCETVIADSPDLSAAYRAYWTGRQALQSHEQQAIALPALAAGSGAPSILFTDDPEVAEHPLADAFTERTLLPPSGLPAAAPTVEQTRLFQFFAAVAADLRRHSSPSLLWIHSAGLSAAWDAPLEMRNHFADEDDPVPPTGIAPPEHLLPPHFDPDESLGFIQAYAGQVTLLDACLGLLLDALAEYPRADDTLLAVTSPRGYPLGEHHRVGPCDHALYAELLQVPLLLRFPGGANALSRSQQIVQPHELYALLATHCGWLPENLNALSVQSAYSIGPGQRSVRTPAWFLRESRVDSEPRYELFAKPDDRWEANEVSSRCGDVVELLAARLDEFAAAARANRLAELPPLAETLTSAWR